MKIPFSFGARLVFRLVLPGLFLTLAFSPAIIRFLDGFIDDVTMNLVLSFSVVVLGWFVMLLDQHIYMIFEGRRYWPKPIWNCMHECEKARYRNLVKKSDAAKKQRDWTKKNEADIEIFQFPLDPDTGMPGPKYPTRLGNLITEFETYPDVKYGTDGVFYWYRIWLKVPKDLRDEIDERQATVDGAIYISAILYLAGFLSMLYGAAEIFFYIDWIPMVSPLTYLYVVPAFWLLAYGLYRLSLHAQQQFGEFFKAIFDQFYTEFDPEPVLNMIADETGQSWVRYIRGAARYKVAWRYLRWHEFRHLGKNSNVNFETVRKK